MAFIQRSTERGITKSAWLFSKHSFSFGSYNNKKREKFGKLLVLNEDILSAGRGFSAHYHQNMEIISIVLQGKLKHEDSAGNKGVLQYGDVQLMSAGTGIEHSEQNGSKDDQVHFLQIWIEPGKKNLPPSYSEKSFKESEFKNKFQIIASGTGEKGALLIHQDARVLLGKLVSGSTQEYITSTDRGIFCFLIKGQVQFNDSPLQSGDSIEFYDEPLIKIQPSEDAHILLLDIPFSS